MLLEDERIQYNIVDRVKANMDAIGNIKYIYILQYIHIYTAVYKVDRVQADIDAIVSIKFIDILLEKTHYNYSGL